MVDSPSGGRSPLFPLLLTGILVWLLGDLVLFVAAWPLARPVSFSEAIIWALSYSWIAYACGAGVLLLKGAFSRQSFGPAAAAYLLPVVVLAAIAGLWFAIYQDPGFRDDFSGFFPMLLVFYLAGVLWMRFRNDEKFAWVRAVLPPLVGGLLMLVFLIAPIIESNAFQYRNAFGFVVTKSRTVDGILIVDAVLEVRKPGDYEFSIPEFDPFGYGMVEGAGPQQKAGKITWGAGGGPGRGKTGTFPLEISLGKAILPQGAAPGFASTAILEVREAAKPREVLYSVSAPLPDVSK